MANDPSNPWRKARPQSGSRTSPSEPEAPKPARSRRPDQAPSQPRDSRARRPRGADEPPAESRSRQPPRAEKPGTRVSKPRTAAKPVREEPSAPPVLQEPHDRHSEYKIYGINACLMAFRRRPQDIVRAYFSQGIAGKFGETMRYLAQQKKAYRVVEDEELERISQSNHHGGVCFLMKKRQPLAAEELLARLASKESVCLLVLEGVGNPHNLGAILRNCAHFDVPAVLVNDANLLQSGAAARVAEGGAEWVELAEYQNFATLLEQLHQAGFSVLSTSSHQGRDLYRTALPARTAILFGEEGRGLRKDTLQASELCVRIPGTTQVESLNVSAATGIILGEFWRQHRSLGRNARTMTPAAAQPKGGRLGLNKKS